MASTNTNGGKFVSQSYMEEAGFLLQK